MDAPVSGGEPGAIEGTLSIMVGADRADFDAVQPILDTVGTTVVLVGPPGSGQTVKAANQLIVAGNIELVAEAIVFLRAYGYIWRLSFRCSSVASPEAESWTARWPTYLPAISTLVSGSTCTTKTWALSLPLPENATS